MPENWELHKDVIKELYITRGFTLEDLRKTMSIKHGVFASSRTYKTKLDEWNIRKNRRKKKFKCTEGLAKIPAPKSVSSTSDSIPPSHTPGASISGEIPISNELNPNLILGSPQTPIEICHPLFQLETVPSNRSQMSNTVHNTVLSNPSDLGPIVNSSLMFFSSRTDSQSLQLLAKFPGMAPRAIEILLRNWKPGGEYMHYALHFLKESVYCHTLLSVNWTRWTHQDETLFDLIDVYVPEDEQVAVTKAILRADLTFQYPLERLHAAWASWWRLAFRQTDWKAAKACLLRLGPRSRLIDCALYVTGESFVRRETQFISWIGTAGDCSVNDNGKIQQILNDCRDLQADWKQIPLPPCYRSLVDVVRI